jgi:ankyrin repeat protein
MNKMTTVVGIDEYKRRLDSAILDGDVDTLRAYLPIVRNLNYVSPLFPGQRPLHVAAVVGNLQIIEMLLGAGASVVRRIDNGETALHAGVARAEVCRLLVAHGADIEAIDKTGATALQSAARDGHVEACRELISLGAKVNVADKAGISPIACAKSSLVAKVLLERGADPFRVSCLRNSDRLTAFQQAIKDGRIEVASYLAEHLSESPSQRAALGKTLLQLARDADSKAFVRALKSADLVGHQLVKALPEPVDARAAVALPFCL